MSLDPEIRNQLIETAKVVDTELRQLYGRRPTLLEIAEGTRLMAVNAVSDGPIDMASYKEWKSKMLAFKEANPDGGAS